MTKQDVVDLVEETLNGQIPIGLRERILDAVWNVLEDHVLGDNVK